MSAYRVMQDGEWVNPTRKGYRMMCCDCGLVHTMDFKLVQHGKKGKVIFLRASRDNRATANARREATPPATETTE